MLHTVRNVDVQLIVPDDLTIIGVDIKLFQLWSNLIKNAIESMDERKERGELIITAKQLSNSIQVNVQNNGPEIPVEIQESIFEKFFTTKSDRNGSGLGLSIVKNVVGDHNATISVSSKLGATVFKINFKQTE
jgi:signal transduction histidine kinase